MKYKAGQLYKGFGLWSGEPSYDDPILFRVDSITENTYNISYKRPENLEWLKLRNLTEEEMDKWELSTVSKLEQVLS